MSDLDDVTKKIIADDPKMGMKTLKAKLRNLGIKVNIDDVQAYKKSLVDELQNKFHKAKFNHRIFFNFIGGWFFDIGVNRAVKEIGLTARQEQQLLYIGVFINGNSGYAVIYDTPNRKAASFDILEKRFKADCKHLQVYVKGEVHTVSYPVKKIVSDMERGWGEKAAKKLVNTQKKIKLLETDGTLIEKYNQDQDHTVLSRINAFMSKLRDWMYVKDRKSRFSPTMLQEFVHKWNQGIVKDFGCTRAEMMVDTKLEEAYIAACLYGDMKVNERREKNIAIGDTITVRKATTNVFDNPQEGKMLPGIYTVSEQVGPMYKVTDENGDTQEIRGHQIVSKIQQNTLINEERERLKDVMNPFGYPGFNPAVHIGPPNPVIQHQAQVMSRARTRKGGRETLALEPSITTDKDTQMVTRSHARETPITQEMIDQPIPPPAPLVLKKQQPLTTKTKKKIVRVIQQLPAEQRMVSRLQEKNLQWEQKGFPGVYDAPTVWKELNKLLDKDLENPKYAFGQPDIRGHKLTPKQLQNVGEILVKQQSEDPYVEQFIPHEKDGTLVKRGRGRPRKH